MTSSTPCPGCGVAVPVGYARCPRCHAPMPSARMRRESLQAGGTSVAEVAKPGRALWIAGGVLLLAGAIVAIALLTGGDRRRAADDGEALEAEEEPTAAAVPIDEPLAPPV